MSNTFVKPHFTANIGSQEQQQDKSKREEVGAIWEKTSKSGMNFMTLRLKMPKERLQKLIDESPDVVNIGFVAFPNSNQQGDTKRPSFRIYEDEDREQSNA
jgi:uncharacterized protein (DUF736 family)